MKFYFNELMAGYTFKIVEVIKNEEIRKGAIEGETT